MVRSALVLMVSWGIGWSVVDFAPAPVAPAVQTAGAAAAVQPL
jgi:hypothetical protein